MNSLSSFTIDTNVRYRGLSEGLGHDRIYVVRNDTTRLLVHHVRHSPTGFSWGYAGSGPAEAARCILADFLALEPIPARIGLYNAGCIPEIDSLYQQFKFDHVATLPANGGAWELDGSEIATWLDAHPPTETCQVCRAPRESDDPFPCVWCTTSPDAEVL